MGELPESVIEDLRAARVAPVPGMLLTGARPVRVVRVVEFHGGDAPAGTLRAIGYEERLGGRRVDVFWTPEHGYGATGVVADPRDRLSFSALVDEAERRGVRYLHIDDATVLLHEVRSVAGWNPRAARVFAALARALAEAPRG
jgi:hypothetical protein